MSVHRTAVQRGPSRSLLVFTVAVFLAGCVFWAWVFGWPPPRATPPPTAPYSAPYSPGQ